MPVLVTADFDSDEVDMLYSTLELALQGAAATILEIIKDEAKYSEDFRDEIRKLIADGSYDAAVDHWDEYEAESNRPYSISITEIEIDKDVTVDKEIIESLNQEFRVRPE